MFQTTNHMKERCLEEADLFRIWKNKKIECLSANKNKINEK